MPDAATSRPSAPAHNGGITLVELIICLAVLAVLSAIAAPSLKALLERHRAIAAEHVLIRHLNLARMAAVTHGNTTVLCPSLDSRRCARGSDWNIGWLLFLDRDGNRAPDRASDVLRAETGPASRHLRLVGTRGRSGVRYLPDGRSAGSNLTISICNQDGTLLSQIIVNNAGRVRSQRPAAARRCPG
jgi:type IV fimbrial biogenesis protein FimT